VAKKVYDSVDRSSAEAITFGIPVSGTETIGSYVAGGAAYRNNVTNSSVSMTGTTLQGRDVMGGASFLLDGSARLGDFSANNNSVTISGGSLSFYKYTAPGATAPESYGGNVYGGYTMFAKGVFPFYSPRRSVRQALAAVGGHHKNKYSFGLGTAPN
jgi:hypothetical protein